MLSLTREETPRGLTSRLREEGCRSPLIAVTEAGQWRMFSPAAPAFAVARFPLKLEIGRAFAVNCGPSDSPIILTQSDADLTVRADVHDTIRVILPTNPSTGYGWRLAAPLPETVLTLVGEPRFAGPGIPGAGGTLTFEFRATGPGLATVQLIEDRTFEANSTINQWSVTVVISGQQAVAWLGEVRSQPQAAPGSMYLELRVPLLDEGAVPPGAGIRASDGATANALAALVNAGTQVLVWGELTCGVVDYGDCRIDATSVVSLDAASRSAAVVGWAGIIRALDGADLFQLDGTFPIQYGIEGATPDVEAQLSQALANGQHIRIWGTLEAPVGDVNRARITVSDVGLAP